MTVRRNSFPSWKGFTLVELLVVIAIIGVLIALLLPAVQSAREAARGVNCRNNLKQLGIALYLHHDVHKTLPAGWLGTTPDGRAPLAEGPPGWGWTAKLLPYMEQTAVAKAIDFGRPIADARNSAAAQTVIPSLLCPSDGGPPRFHLHGEGAAPDGPGHDHAADLVLPSVPKSNYVGMFGTLEIEACEGLAPGVLCTSDGVFFHNRALRLADISDGLSQTILVGERSSRLGGSTWLGAIAGAQEAFARIVGTVDHAPNHPTSHFDDFGSFHPFGTYFLWGDGSVRYVNEAIDLATYQAMATRAGQEVVGPY